VLYASSNSTLSKSSDQGLTWKQLKEFDCEGIDCVYVDGKGVVFVSPGIGAKPKACGIWRSTDEGKSWEKTLCLSEFCSVWNIAQDRSGTLFAGVYTRGNKQKRAEIYNSKDSGNSWHQIYFDGKARHIHHVSVAKDTDYIYACVGDKSVPQSNIAYIIRSIDHGNSWSRILPKLPQISAIQPLLGARLFGTDDACNGQLYRTTDDVTVEKVLDTGANSYCFWIRQHNLTGCLFASFVAGEANQKTAGVYLSQDGGLTWSRWQTFATDAAYEGSTRASNFVDGRLYFSLRLEGCRKSGVKVWLA
jgi:photosystem II stability/assembly factor-like uncharacterized protein